jgi:hypothetical protein
MWEDIHPEWYFLIQVPNQLFLEVNSPRRWACSILNYENLCGKIRIASGSVEKVLGESLNLITLNFNESID